MIKPSWLTEGFGWVGVVAILAAYALLTFGVWNAGDWTYHALNAIGALGIVIDAAAQRNWQPAVLNAVWLGLAAVGIVSALGLFVPSVEPEQDAAGEWNNSFVTQDQEGSLRYPSDMDVLDADAQEAFHFLATVDTALGSDLTSYSPVNYAQDGRVVVAHDRIGSEECYAPPAQAGDAAFDREESFGNATWKVAEFSDAAAGNRYDVTLYRTMRKGTCYEIAQTVHSASDWTDVDESAIERSLDALQAQLDAVVHTFAFGS